jgi:predicted secreted protein
MTSNAFIGVATILKIDGDIIAEINSVSITAMSRAMIDATSLDSAGGYREFIPGFRDRGELVLTMNFTQNSYHDFLAAFQDKKPKTVIIVLSNAEETVLVFNSFITKIGTEVPLDDKVSIDVTAKINSPITVGKEGVLVQIGESTFAGKTGQTVDITPMVSGDYHVSITPLAESGSIGEVWISTRTTNAFVVKNSGTDVSSAFTWCIVGMV